MKEKTYTLAVGGMLTALMLVMRVLGIDILPIPPAGVAVSHIPVILGTILAGLPVGLFLSLIFGGVSLYQAYTTPMVLGPAFMNPLVSVVPRLLIPVVVWLVGKLMRDKKDGASLPRVAALAVAGSLTNTILVLLALGALYGELLVGAGASPQAIALVAGTIALTNGLPEAATCALLCVPIVKAVSAVRKPRGGQPEDGPRGGSDA